MRNKIIFIIGMLFSCTLFSSHSLTNEPVATPLLSMHAVHRKIKTSSPQSNSVLESYIKLSTIDGEAYIIKKPPIITEKDFVWISLKNEAYFRHGEAIEFSLTEPAKKRFANFTKQNIGKQFAIVVESKIISAPVIQSPIFGGKGLITGKNMRELYYSLRKVVKTKNSSFYCKALPETIQTYFKCI